MRLSPALILSALIGLATVPPVLVMVVRAIRRCARPYCRPYVLLGCGAAAAVLAVLAVTGTALSLPRTQAEATRTVLASGAVAAVALAAVLLVAGLLLLPGVAASPQLRARRLLDGVMLSASGCFVVWTFVAVLPRGGLPLPPSRALLAAAIPAAIALAVWGIAVQTALRAPAPRGGATLSAAGVALVVGGLAGFVAAFSYAHGTLIAASGTVIAAGLVALALAGPYTDRTAPAADDADSTIAGIAVPIVAVCAIAVASISSLVSFGKLDIVSVVVGLVDGVALLARQTLAVYDARRAATRLAQSEAHYRELAHTDALTGLANRRGLLRVLFDQAIGGRPCVLLALDLDGFKNINDMRGHDVGDTVLTEVGVRLRTHLRPGDVAARLGGDEFAVLMWARPGEAAAVAHRLLDVVGRPYDQPKGTVFLSTSIGMAASEPGTNVPALLRNADLALRYAKQRGKARVELYDGRYDALLRRRSTVEQELRCAIERDELRLAFQPVVSLPSVRPAGAEALLRWHNPRLGVVTPTEFIPIAEETGLIRRLGLFVLHRACRQLSRWLAEGHDVWVSCNVSVRELHAPDYCERVAEVLRAHQVPPQRLVLEVTEQRVATEIDELVSRLAELRAAGVRIALDDFGAGYSSLGQLQLLPVDILKIDRGLLAAPAPSAMAGPGSAAPLVDVVVRLGHRLGLTVIAEGVELVAQRQLLDTAGCGLAQGLLFGAPMPAEHMEAMLAAAVQVPARRAQHVGPVDSAREMRQA